MPYITYADAGRGNNTLRHAPHWAIEKINERRMASGLNPLPFDGLPDDDPRHSAEQRIYNGRRSAAIAIGRPMPTVSTPTRRCIKSRG